MGVFKNLRKALRAKLSPGAPARPANEQAVLVHLDGTGLSDDVYRDFDVSSLEDHLIECLQATGVGQLDGHESGPEVTTIYLYGRDAEVLFTAVEPVLSNYPFCRNAKVSIRRGGPGSAAREVLITG